MNPMSYQPPVLMVPLTQQDKLLNKIAIAGFVALFLVAVYGTFVLPDTIPVHFGFNGRVNGWGSKSILWILPGLGLFIYGLLTLIARSPHNFNYLVEITEHNAFRQYQIATSTLNWLKTELVWIFAFMEWKIFNLATVENPSLGIWFLPAILLIIFGTIGYWLRQSFLAR
ncbi:hypothetical protein CK510_04970 [Brunnivagina elsteri CCALA 953]|uniref:DUF1648 domain-containing protein n=2 Tax=Brunnivagina TaxID=3344733 RepID=A0A2A2TNZ8_9CYAN|nr:hypothetical protein CK510_04970 [Calothrix elsteri CCALA 953]